MILNTTGRGGLASTMALIITLLVLGAVLLFLETLLPGMVVGIIGFLCLVAAVILAYQNSGVQTGNLVLGSGCGGSGPWSIRMVEILPGESHRQTVYFPGR